MNYNIASYDFEVQDNAFLGYVPWFSNDSKDLLYRPWGSYAYWILIDHKDNDFVDITLFLGLEPVDYYHKFSLTIVGGHIDEIKKLFIQVCSSVKVSPQHIVHGLDALASFPLAVETELYNVLQTKRYYVIEGVMRYVSSTQLLHYWRTGELEI